MRCKVPPRSPPAASAICCSPPTTTASSRARADRVARARALLAVAGGASYTAAAATAGRRSGDGVALLVRRFHRLGLGALDGGHGGGPPVQYGPTERARILAEVQRVPDRSADGT